MPHYDASVLGRLRSRQEARFFAALFRAAPLATVLWWTLIVLRGVVPAVVSVSLGLLVAALTNETSLTGPLILMGISFTFGLILNPLHQLASSNLGSRMAAHLYDRLMIACVRQDGIGHLESSSLTNDLVMARDFDLGMMGPPLDISMDFIAGGLVNLVVGLAAACLLFGFHWWVPPVLIAGWLCTHWLLRESGVWKDRNTDTVRTAQRHADYSYRLAVDAGPAKELRFFGLAGWVTERFVSTRTTLYELQFQATRLREKSVVSCVLIVAAINGGVFALLASDARSGDLSAGRVVLYAQAIIGVASIAFGGLNWALDGASAPVAALARFEAAVGTAGSLRGAELADAVLPTDAGQAHAVPDTAPEIRFVDVDFSYPSVDRAVLNGFDLTIPAGTSMAIVGQNGAGKTTLAKLLCRLYDTSDGQILVDGCSIESIDVDRWRQQITAVFQDYVRFELSVRVNVAPDGASDDQVRAALVAAGADHLADGNLDTILSKGYPGGTDLSGGQWQRIALARALCAVSRGARVVLLDEPTAQLDVRGEAEIFERVLQATRQCTTILISHRFSTVRLADRICVVEDGRVIELGTHLELIELGGRYRTMFDLQASRFVETDADGQEMLFERL